MLGISAVAQLALTQFPGAVVQAAAVSPFIDFGKKRKRAPQRDFQLERRVAIRRTLYDATADKEEEDRLLKAFYKLENKKLLKIYAEVNNLKRRLTGGGIS